MKILTLAAALAMTLPVQAAQQSSTPASASAPASVATALLDRLDAHDYTGAEAMFDARMAAAVPAAKLQGAWESLASKPLVRGTPVSKTRDGMSVVEIPLHGSVTELVAKVAIGADGRIAGFLIQPAAAPAAAPVAADATFTEQDFTLGSGATALPGTLSMPKSAAASHPVPAVVLVHGSGPNDRDETIGPNKPFVDIARGLAAQGIAVLRYEKRTRAHPSQLKGTALTIDAETTDDAVAAMAALRTTPGIDPKRVFVLGHSQGAMMAPRIALHDGHAAGVVLLAAPARKLLDILVEQNERLARMNDGKIDATEAAAIAKLRSQAAALRGTAPVADADTPMQEPATYWRSVDAVDPIADARKLRVPMLVLQGGRDIQVVQADSAQWHQAFGHTARVTFHGYPALNHLGIAGTGPGTLAEYAKPGHVDAQLIADVATWIRAH